MIFDNQRESEASNTLYISKEEQNSEKEQIRKENVQWVLTVISIFIVLLWFAICERLQAGLNHFRTLIS
jgi:uncharacterized membrane protein YkgB